jgi:hypothetical protein
MHQILVNGDLLSHGSFILQSECAAHNYASNLSGTKNANILSANNFKLIHTQNKLPCLKFYQLTKHYSGKCSIPLLQDYSIVSCQLWVGQNSLNTTEQKSSVKHILHPSCHKFHKRVPSTTRLNYKTLWVSVIYVFIVTVITWIWSTIGNKGILNDFQIFVSLHFLLPLFLNFIA